MTRKIDQLASTGADLAELDAALTSLRRSQARRALARLAEQRRSDTAREASPPDAVFELIDAIASSDTPLTVTQAAGLLGVDQPRASRLTSQAIAAGMVRRTADQRDGRRSLLVATAKGRQALDQVGAFRRQVIAEATAAWAAEDLASLAGLLARFVDDLADVTGSR